MNFDRNAPSKNALLTQIGLALGQVRAEYTPDETIFRRSRGRCIGANLSGFDHAC